MNLDLRIPMGLMFTLVGIILTAFGIGHQWQHGALRAQPGHQRQSMVGNWCCWSSGRPCFTWAGAGRRD